MKSYVIEFNGSGEVSEGFFSNDREAVAWAETVLETRGFDLSEIVSGEWDAHGADGFRLLFWANEETAQNDAGQNAICQLVNNPLSNIGFFLRYAK